MRNRYLITLIVILIASSMSACKKSHVERNVVIGMYSGLALLMDVHYPEKPNGYAIVHVAGSGWSTPLSYNAPLLSQRQVDRYGMPLTRRGYTVFSLNHRSSPRFQLTDQLEDVRRAVRFIRYHADVYGIDPERIGAIGGSSGGHLVSLLGVMSGAGEHGDEDPINRESAKVQAVVVRAAPANLEPLLYNPELSMAVDLLVGASIKPDLAQGRLFLGSPINHISPDDPPFLLIHGDKDDIVPIHQGEIMRDSLKASGVDARLLIIPEAGHGPAFPGAENPPDYIAEMVEWFDVHLVEH